MVAMRYYGNVMTTTMSQYSDDVSSVTHAGCICAPVNAITTCIYCTHRSDHTKTSVRRQYVLRLCGSVMEEKKNITSSVYDCTVEDVEYIYNKLSIHIFNSKSRLSVL